MILLAEPENRQAAACWPSRSGDPFPRRSMPGKLMSEAHPSNKHRVSVCQYCYPSPSRRSDPVSRVRPSLSPDSGQGTAENRYRPEIYLAFDRLAVVPAFRVCANNPKRGELTCRNQYHSYSSQRCLGFRHAPKAATLNVPFWARRSAVRPVRYWTTANVSLVQRLAVPQAHWLTTSNLAARIAAFEVRAARHFCRAALFCLGKLPNDMGDTPCSRKF